MKPAPQMMPICLKAPLSTEWKSWFSLTRWDAFCSGGRGKRSAKKSRWHLGGYMLLKLTNSQNTHDCWEYNKFFCEQIPCIALGKTNIRHTYYMKTPKSHPPSRHVKLNAEPVFYFVHYSREPGYMCAKNKQKQGLKEVFTFKKDVIRPIVHGRKPKHYFLSQA